MQRAISLRATCVCGFDDVLAVLRQRPDAVLASAAPLEDAPSVFETALTVGTRRGDFVERVRVAFREVASSDGHATWALSWSRPTGSKLLPAFTGHLVANAVEQGTTLVLDGAYQTPAPRDRERLQEDIRAHVLAIATLEDFLVNVVGRVEAASSGAELLGGDGEELRMVEIG